MKKLALTALCATYLSGYALAQDARTVIADAQRALGNPQSVTYSGSAKDVAFQQCGANATALICYGTHDPMRPITNYVRVIDLNAPLSRHTGTTMNFGRRRLDARSLRERSSSRSRRRRPDLSQPVGAVGRVLHHAVGLSERRGREQRDGRTPHRRRQELYGRQLEPDRRRRPPAQAIASTAT